jgi:hypothetical protein
MQFRPPCYLKWSKNCTKFCHKTENQCTQQARKTSFHEKYIQFLKSGGNEVIHELAAEAAHEKHYKTRQLSIPNGIASFQLWKVVENVSRRLP